ncbi:MAG: hypothetical protein IPG51_09455 [Chloroflexi bacterium]|nr:hypothetical protein [Chloroflexota bacterium]
MTHGMVEVSLNSQPTSQVKSDRVVYLEETLHLRHDPFSYPVAEVEIQVNPYDPPFFRYYVDPPYESADEANSPLLDNLEQSGAAIIYGAAGSGKTTLCYRLEAACRETAVPTLTLNHVLGKDPDLTDPEGFWQTLNEGLATDLFIQVLERFDSFSPTLLTELTPSLAHYWTGHIPQFSRNIQRHLAQRQPTAATGMSAQWWPIWQRAAVRYTPFTPARAQFLSRLLETSPPWSNGQLIDKNSFQKGIALAQRLGFAQVFFLVDIVEAEKRAQKKLDSHIQRLWRDLLPLPMPIPFYPKFFLPIRLKPLLDSLIGQIPLISPIFSAIMNWNRSQALTELIENRFRSAGGWIRGFDVLASEEIVSELSEAILRVANHSPRRLLQVHSLLIEAHVSRDPKDPQITTADWQRLCDLWSYDPPSPIPLMGSATIVRS